MERSLTIKVSFQDAKGKAKTKKFRDWEARIFQHEYDHLDGVVYIDRLSPEGREKVRSLFFWKGMGACVGCVRWGLGRVPTAWVVLALCVTRQPLQRNNRCSRSWTSSSRTSGPAGRCDRGQPNRAIGAAATAVARAACLYCVTFSFGRWVVVEPAFPWRPPFVVVLLPFFCGRGSQHLSE